MAKKLQRIDELLRMNHHYFDDGDACFFYGEYTAQRGHGFSKVNNLILNLKKSVNKRGLQEWQYKEAAMNEVVDIFMSLEAWKKLKECTWIPIPPSKSKSDPLYDDRLVQILKLMKKREPCLDYRELVFISQSRTAAHNTEHRPTPKDHYKRFEIDTSLKNPPPKTIVIYDDVITTGSGYKAMKQLLAKTYPNANIIGVFIARIIRNENPNTN